MHPRECVVTERLRSERKSIHTCSDPSFGSNSIYVFRVHLDRELSAGRERECSLDELDGAAHAIASQTRWRSTAQVDRLDLRRFAVTEAGAELRLQRREVLGDGHIAADRDGEIAVAAAARTEGDVEIDVAQATLGDGLEGDEFYPAR